MKEQSSHDYKMWFRWRQIMSVAIVMMFLNVATSSSQPSFGLQFCLGGSALTWFSFMVEVNAYTFTEDFPVQSIRLSTGYGLPMLNASFLPIEIRFVGLQGSNHVEVIAGCSIQVKWKETANTTFVDLRSSLLNPTAAVGYRYEPEDGGFVFRFSVGALYAVSDARYFPAVTGAFGWAF